MAKKIANEPIKRRTVLYTYDNGVFRFLNWAIVETSLGTMAEPFMPNRRHVPGNGYVDHDPSDPMARIDDMRNVPPGMEKFIFSDQGTPLMGGNLSPREFIRIGNFA